MTCPLCGARKAKRACPATGRDICPHCCGTKRLVELRCPAECGYLETARLHPAAAVQRQHDRDVALLAPAFQRLTQRQSHVLLLLQGIVLEHAASAVPRIIDRDVGDAAGSLAATFETATRGIIYDHQPSSLPAQRLMQEVRTALADLAQKAQASLDVDAAVVLRRIESLVRQPELSGAGETAYLELLGRISGPPKGGPASSPITTLSPSSGVSGQAPTSRLVLP